MTDQPDEIQTPEVTGGSGGRQQHLSPRETLDLVTVSDGAANDDFGSVALLCAARSRDGNKGITALGYWNVGNDDRTMLSFFDSGGQLIESGTSPAVANNLSFVGIVSDIPATRVVISATIGNGKFGIDNLQLQTAVIPEPGTLSLLTLGGLAVLRRRKHRIGK